MTVTRYTGEDGVLVFREHPGVAPACLAWEVSKHGLVRVLAGAYLHPDRLDDDLVRLQVVCRARSGAVVIRRAALDMLPMLAGDTTGTILSIAAPHNLRLEPPYVFVRRDIPADRLLEAQGLRWTEPTYTAVDLMPVDGGAAACELLRAAGANGARVLEEMQRIVVAMARQPWAVERRRVLADLRARPWSMLELELHRLLRAHGIVGWRANHPLRSGGRQVFVDVAFPADGVAIEADGRAHHSNRDAFERDRQRWNALAAEGWIVLRVTWDMVHRTPELVVAQIRAALESRVSTDRWLGGGS